MHTSLFSLGHSRREVKKALIQHQKRDSRMVNVLDLVFGVCVIYLVRNLPLFDGAAIFVGVYVGITGMRYFVDQSIRNFYLHRLDWEESEPDD